MEINIKVQRYIIHYLEKDQSKKVADLQLSEEVSFEDEFSNKLSQDIHISVSENSFLKNTKYKAGNSTTFSTTLKNYFECSDNEEFINFTKSIAELKEKLDKVPFATGGYYVFIDYIINNKRYISVVLLRKKDGINVTRVGNVFKLNSTENLNIDKIAMAFRFNYDIYIKDDKDEDKDNYIAFITTQQDGNISNYFTEWVNTGDLIKSSKNTSSLIKIIKSIDRPKDEKGNDVYNNIVDFQNEIFNFFKNKKSINLADLSLHLYNDSSKIANYSKEQNVILDYEFKKNNVLWNKLIQVKAKVDGIELNVDANKLNSSNVDLKGDTIIIHSKLLADKIRLEIERNGLKITENDIEEEDRLNEKE